MIGFIRNTFSLIKNADFFVENGLEIFKRTINPDYKYHKASESMLKSFLTDTTSNAVKALLVLDASGTNVFTDYKTGRVVKGKPKRDENKNIVLDGDGKVVFQRDKKNQIIRDDGPDGVPILEKSAPIGVSLDDTGDNYDFGADFSFNFVSKDPNRIVINPQGEEEPGARYDMGLSIRSIKTGLDTMYDETKDPEERYSAFQYVEKNLGHWQDEIAKLQECFDDIFH